ncbi:hypothetical protein [Amorphus sp. 3PC139-8]|uniref:hypothetical protein n=1 Tax=Amorphus sp. 3PC139-8 TaxID=2735676 RepID=UPI00345C6C82
MQIRRSSPVRLSRKRELLASTALVAAVVAASPSVGLAQDATPLCVEYSCTIPEGSTYDRLYQYSTGTTGGGTAPSNQYPGQNAPGTSGSDITIVNNGTFAKAGNVPITISTTGGNGADGSDNVYPGSGGDGGSITFTNAGDITANGSNAATGNIEESFVLNLTSTGGNTGGWHIGRDLYEYPTPSAGGSGGDITVTLKDGSTLTLQGSGGDEGDESYVVYAVSQGGDGTTGAEAEHTFEYSTQGSDGGTGGAVSATVDGKVSASPDYVAAIYLESIGGDGGTGGQDNADLDQLPGDGGAGGDAGTASLTLGSAGSIKTTGTNAPAAIVQAVGGNGASPGSFMDWWTSAYNGGQSGGAGGAGYDSTATSETSVTFSNAGTITTQGDASPGVVLQSAGGVGANGGADIGSSSAYQSGGDGGKGGAVEGHNTGTISTKGDYSIALFAQSVGASGGAGVEGGDGGTAGDGNSVTLTNTGTISTEGAGAAAILAQSVGGGNAAAAANPLDNALSGIDTSGTGGGTAGGSSGWLSFAEKGGDGGSGGVGGAITVTNEGTVITKGAVSPGIWIQSLGGGGASGGSIDSTGAVLNLSAGGDGGNGGAGGDVTVLAGSSPGSISTSGLVSPGILAFSIGGGGGVAGGVDATTYSVALPAISINVGGNGGTGGTGGTITIDNTSTIKTEGIDSHGVFAASIGGSGGAGGQATDKSEATAFDEAMPNVSVGWAVGGDGGSGGDGGEVKITNKASITTSDMQSFGISASSLGGGGGTGANASATAQASGKAVDVALSVTLGGVGGATGQGGKVTVDNKADITTNGFFSYGIFAQSVGGGGGTGGTGSAQDGDASRATQSVAVNIGLGGKDSAGGDGGTVIVTNEATLVTTGADSTGILAQSIGGGGGTSTGGNATATTSATGDKNNDGLQVEVAMGSDGGNGGTGGEVKVTNDAKATIKTMGVGSHGIHAQSVGGGGGTGGTVAANTPDAGMMARAENRAKANMKSAAETSAWNKMTGSKGSGSSSSSDNYIRPSYSAGMTVGGKSGNGGDGGTVTVENDGTTTTDGNGAFGLFGQSVGGGGGSAGAASTTSSSTFNLDVAIGSPGGLGGTGGTVTAANSGSIGTSGHGSLGIVAQSVGGGGGLAASTVATSSGDASITHSFGASGGSDAVGGTVTVDNSGSVTTSGQDAHGVVAQSIGSGGGIGVLGAVELNTVKDNGTNPFETDLTVGHIFGGTQTDGGHGGSVTINQSGTVSTTGRTAFGIIAQSIGGGGGMSVDAAGPLVTATVSGAHRLSGSHANGASNGGDVTISLAKGSSITTTGTGSVGIVAQSVGGGGGYTGSFGSRGMSYSDWLSAMDNLIIDDPAGTGTGGAVLIQDASSGGGTTISTTGSRAHGIVAQSLGGGGGLAADDDGLLMLTTLVDDSGTTYRRNAFGSATGSGGTVTIDLTGSISATGSNAYGIWAMSGQQLEDGTLDPNNPGGVISVTFDGDITGGSDSGAGIRVDGGSNNTGFKGTNYISFSGGTLQAGSGTAIIATTPIDVFNTGTIIGNLDFVRGGTFSNEPGGRFEPGTSLDMLGDGTYAAGGVSAQATFMNYGSLNVGGANKVAQTALTGSFSHFQGADWTVDMDFAAGTNDSLSATGAIAFVGGSITPQVLALPSTFDPSTPFQATFATSTQSVDIGQATATDSLVVNYDLQQPDPTSASIVVSSVDFATPASKLSDASNYASAASYLQQHWNAGNLGQLGSHYVTLMNEQTSSGYQEALKDIVPETNAVTAATAPNNAKTFQNQIHSCPVFVGDSASLSEESCVYVRGTYMSLDHGSDGQITGYDEDQSSIQIGGEASLEGNPFLGDNWFVGAAALYTDSSIKADDHQSSGDGDAWSIGAVLKYQPTPNWLLAASAGYTFGQYDFDRSVSVAGVPATASSTQDIHTISARIRAAYDVDLGHWYLRPAANLDFMYVNVPAYSESGAGVLNMNFESSNDSQVGFTPEIEIGGRIDTAMATLRPYANAGVTFWSDSSWTQRSRLAGAPVGAAAIETSYEGDDIIGNLNLGLDAIMKSGLELKAQYGLQASDDFTSHTGTLRVGYRF